MLDDILRTELQAVVEEAIHSGLASLWFFVRYSDPYDHLRVRFACSSASLCIELFTVVTASLNPLVAAGRIWKIQFDTYEREIERYGGAEGLVASENLFFADSDSVVSILRALKGEHGELRWKLALLGVDRLFGDCGLEIAERHKLVKQMRDSFQKEFRFDIKTKSHVSDMFRGERRTLAAIIEGRTDTISQFGAEEILQRRSARAAPCVQTLPSLSKSGRLQRSVSSLAVSYAHMHINRMVGSRQRLHEAILYDFLYRLYDQGLALTGLSEGGRIKG